MKQFLLRTQREEAAGTRRRHPFERISNAAKSFHKDEDGTVTLLSFFMFLVMIAAAGIAIDAMRLEMERAQLQNTLDSAVLAAAGSPYGADPEAIVVDYFETADMSDYLKDFQEGDIVTTLNSSKVTANAEIELETYLMKLSGIKTLSTAGSSTAEMRVPKLEVSLVLDVSGSMGSNSKLTNLKSAAKEFVTTILDSSDPGDTVISLVPFSWSVTPTSAMFDALAVDERQNYSTCLRFKDNDYGHASLTSGNAGFSSGIPVDQMIYTSVYGGFDDFGSSGWRSCFAQDSMEILPFSISESALHTKIDALTADGNTSGNQGMNWGAALLDPTFRQITGDLIAAGEMDATLTTVPTDYDEPETLKVIVMMGDGQNTTSYFFNQGQYRGNNSDLYLVQMQDRVFKYAFHKYKKNKISYSQSKCTQNKWECVYEASGPIESIYYLESGGNYYNIDDEEWISGSDFSDLQGFEGFISQERLDWEVAWGLITPQYYGNVTGDWGPWNDYVGSGNLSGSAKDTRMSNVCSATKDENVVVYTIGFEIGVGGNAETQLKNCASSVAHYYRAEGASINDAFNSIASNVVNLRLTQ